MKNSPATATPLKKVIVEVENLKLVFPARIHRPTTVRDVFVRAVTHPFEYLLRAPQTIEILNGVSLKVREGDRIGLIGVNGTGKTSFCRVLAGLYRASKGLVTVNGKTRAIFDTMVGIFPELTGRENAFILADFIYPLLQDREAKINEALAFTELGDFLDTPFKYYSNGMQARLCLATLTIEPTDLLILDEVFEGADQFFREKIAERVLGIIEKSGAVIFVSHSEDQVLRVCNRVVLLNHGHVAFDGPVAEGLAYYKEICDPRRALHVAGGPSDVNR